MPDERINFVVKEAGTDVLAGSATLSVNLLPSIDGSIRVRPGLAVNALFPPTPPSPDPVVGMIIFNNDLVYVTRDSLEIGRASCRERV